MYDFTNIAVYYDLNGKLVGIPTGINPNVEYDTRSLDIFYTLESGYNDTELENFLTIVFDACYSKEYVENMPFGLQVYTNKKSIASASKGFQLVTLCRYKKGSYEIKPWIPCKKHKGAFVPVHNISIKIELYSKFIPVEKGALALAFKAAMGIIENAS
ncbi:MAG: hypothetical protein FWC16_00105 [Defluviitaleaceae bacterium]|nr:hypothetical protein [Defluviitaleaceae bacterium]MCL2273304.1 hypothetical protein [Defluviitaleaceae bacterium]